jgi:hypothetical protein
LARAVPDRERRRRRKEEMPNHINAMSIQNKISIIIMIMIIVIITIKGEQDNCQTKAGKERNKVSERTLAERGWFRPKKNT